ncbi:nucleotide disphospho-sugar-binding domain-containing protein [Polaromonas sp. A23]|uniref:nucleotide disphospho-sugar-binding domain-containing protein n=1 Tax=Polaromonas sp. A23 TaxID=1944133 RepID=UPI000984713D|nr:nucleotide disphospho-sugar-binding domain-containing protein [Polaromonas sp. A23]OOG44432.1 hypothetical protein B0B52_06720 [Polaromonas sp. A23]
MSRILFAWELGANLGHIRPLVSIANALRQNGHEIVFVLQDIRGCGEFLRQHEFAYFQTPTLPGRLLPGMSPEQVSYPEILLLHGFGNEKELASVLQAWRNLYSVLKPEVMVFDYAPTALLAARDLGIPRVAFSTGFTSPPRVTPLPCFRPWEYVPSERLLAAEARVLDAVNGACETLAISTLSALHEMFGVEEDILATLSELDHYPGRQGAEYWGPIHEATEGEVPIWPEGTGKRIFVYLRPKSPAFKPLVSILAGTELRILWFAPGLATQTMESLQTKNMCFSSKPFAMTQVADSAEAAVLHGGHGTVATLLLGGVPMLLLPANAEQLLVARNVSTLGAGLIAAPRVVGDFLPLVTQLVQSKVLSERAKAVAKKYQGFDPVKQIQIVVARIEQLML